MTVRFYCPLRRGHPLKSATMFAPAVALSLLVAPATPDSWQGHEAECRQLEDAVVPGSREAGADYMAAGDECRRAFETVPGMDQRSYFVFEAHRLYTLAHAAGHAAALCADSRALEAFAKQLAALEPGLRTRDRKDVEQMQEQIAGKLAAPCQEPEAAEGQVRDTQASLASNVVPAPVAPMLRSSASPALPDDRGPMRPRQPLRIAGGTAIGLGLGLGAGMIAALVRGAALHSQAASMTHGGQLVPEADVGYFKNIDARGHRSDTAAIGLGVAGGVLAVVGVSLVVVDARKSRAPRRVALGSSVLPTAGLRITMEF